MGSHISEFQFYTLYLNLPWNHGEKLPSSSTRGKQRGSKQRGILFFTTPALRRHDLTRSQPVEDFQEPNLPGGRTIPNSSSHWPPCPALTKEEREAQRSSPSMATDYGLVTGLHRALISPHLTITEGLLMALPSTPCIMMSTLSQKFQGIREGIDKAGQHQNQSLI